MQVFVDKFRPMITISDRNIVCQYGESVKDYAGKR